VERYLVAERWDRQIVIRPRGRHDVGDVGDLSAAFTIASELAGWGPPMRIYPAAERRQRREKAQRESAERK
jgi:hypothetical protein